MLGLVGSCARAGSDSAVATVNATAKAEIRAINFMIHPCSRTSCRPRCVTAHAPRLSGAQLPIDGPRFHEQIRIHVGHDPQIEGFADLRIFAGHRRARSSGSSADLSFSAFTRYSKRIPGVRRRRCGPSRITCLTSWMAKLRGWRVPVELGHSTKNLPISQTLPAFTLSQIIGRDRDCLRSDTGSV